MLFLLLTFFFMSFLYNQVVTCCKHCRTNLPGSQFIALIRNG